MARLENEICKICLILTRMNTDFANSEKHEIDHFNEKPVGIEWHISYWIYWSIPMLGCNI